MSTVTHLPERPCDGPTELTRTRQARSRALPARRLANMGFFRPWMVLKNMEEASFRLRLLRKMNSAFTARSHVIDAKR